MSPVFFRPVVTGESHLILGRNLRVAPLVDSSEDLRMPRFVRFGRRSGELSRLAYCCHN